MIPSARQQNMLEAVSALKELLEPGLLGHFTWFQAVEVIATGPGTGSTGTRQARNIFSIYVAETGKVPPAPASPFVNSKPWRLKGLDDWVFGCTKRPVEINSLLDSIERYGREGVWMPPGQPALAVGGLVAASRMFCPSDSRTEIALNAVLKNNFWSGSYVIELKDDAKSTLSELVQSDALFEQLADKLAQELPLDLGRVPDRIGDVLFQVPSNALIAEYGRRPSMPVDLHLAWNPDVSPRTVDGEYRVEQDGLIASLDRFEFPAGSASLKVPANSGELRFTVWDSQRQMLLSASPVRRAPDGRGFVESSVRYGVDLPRRFVVAGPNNAVEPHEVRLVEPAGGTGFIGQQGHVVDWVARRERKAQMKQLVSSKRFLQYGTGKASQQDERRRALDDLRELITTWNAGAIYLWDPYLSANDILNTLAFCSDTGTDLRALTSAKPSKKSTCADEDDGVAGAVATSNRESWIKDQRERLNTAFTGPPNMRLEFRMSFGVNGGFHDRFLVFPGAGRHRSRAWSLGASINHIGAEHCVVQEVAYPEPVLQAFLSCWDQSDTPEHLIWKHT